MTTIEARSESWQPKIVLFSKQLIDGSKSSGLLMRQKIDGRWQYREMTKIEEGQWNNADAW